MELITNTFSSIWTALEAATVPILNIPFTTFLLGQLILFSLIGLLNFLFGKHGDSKGDK